MKSRKVQPATSTAVSPSPESSPSLSPEEFPVGNSPAERGKENSESLDVLLGGFNTAVRAKHLDTLGNSVVSPSEDVARGSRSSYDSFQSSATYFNVLGTSTFTPKCFSEIGCPWGYKAPKFSGRLNRGVDWRGDYYALGVVMYELFVGILPFESSDETNLIYKHIAEIPKTLRKQYPAKIDMSRNWPIRQISDTAVTPKQHLPIDSSSSLQKALVSESPPQRVSSRISSRSLKDGFNQSSLSFSGKSSMNSEIDFKTVLKASLMISEGSKVEDIVVSLVGSVSRKQLELTTVSF